MASKREREIDLEDFEEVSNVKASPKAKIQGVLTSLSPMKKSKTGEYFDGELSDGKTSMRVFGFGSGVRRKLADFEGSSCVVALDNCEVKKGRYGQELQAQVRETSDVHKTDKVVEISKDVPKKIGKEIGLSELPEMAVFQRAIVEVKVIRGEEVEEVSGGKKKRDLVIADSNGTARLTVWEQEIEKVEVGKSYCLSGLMVREFRGKKFLSTSKDRKFAIEAIPDMEEVAEESAEEASAGARSSQGRVRNARIIGVKQFDKYSACLKCKSKLVVDSEEPDLGHCQKCEMMQCLDSGTQGVSALLVVEGGDGRLTLRAFGKVVENIAQKSGDEVSMGALLKAQAFTMVHDNGIIQSITRSA